MQHSEEIRSLLIDLGLVVAIAAYFKIIFKAFARSPLWGIFSVFCPPLGGWVHSFTSWWDMSKTFTVHVAGFVVWGYALLFFPREPVYGYWTDASGAVVLNFQENGTVRDYGLKPDGKFSFRGAKLLTIELGIPSPTRLKLSMQGEYHVAYYSPKPGVLRLYHERRDPEAFFGSTVNMGLELHRVADPAAADFTAKLGQLAYREGAYDSAARLLEAVDKGALDQVPDKTLLPRYERFIALARSASAAELEKQPIVEQVNALRLRALYAQEIKGGANAAAIAAEDLKRDYFMLQPFVHAPITNVTVDPEQKKASVVVVANQRMGIIRTLQATEGEKGTWNFVVLEARDADIATSTRYYPAKSAPLTRALSYLAQRLSIPGQPELLQPLGS